MLKTSQLFRGLFLLSFSIDCFHDGLALILVLDPGHCILLSSPISVLPFGTRGYSRRAQEDEEDETLSVSLADVVSEGDDVREIKALTSFPGTRRNSVVESFFANDEFSIELKEEVHKHSKNMFDFLQSTRRALHRHPELMYNEKETSAYIQNVLGELDVPFTTGKSPIAFSQNVCPMFCF